MFVSDEPLGLITEGDQHCISIPLKANQICMTLHFGYLDRHRMDGKQNQSEGCPSV